MAPLHSSDSIETQQRNHAGNQDGNRVRSKTKKKSYPRSSGETGKDNSRASDSRSMLQGQASIVLKAVETGMPPTREELDSLDVNFVECLHISTDPVPEGTHRGQRGIDEVPASIGRMKPELASAMRGAFEQAERLLFAVQDLDEIEVSQVDENSALDSVSPGEKDPLPYSDSGNAERLIRLHGSNLRYCHDWKKWLHWTGDRWSIDRTGMVRHLALKTVRTIELEDLDIREDASEEAIKEARSRKFKHALSSENAGRIDAMIKQATAEQSMPILPEEMNRDPFLFNCRNGTINLKTGELRPHDRNDLITAMSPVDYDPDAKCPLWLATLDLFFEGNQELIGYLQRTFGYAMTGVVREQVLPIFHGSGSNGKSTIINAILEIWGSDYAMKTSPSFLMDKATEDHPTERASLLGKRAVFAIETESGRRLNETLVKELTGNDRISARRMREDPWEFNPTHKLFMATNHKPVIRGTDYAIWRRLQLVPFNVKLEGDGIVDLKMPEKLKGEYPGILAWCVRGCLAWQKGNLQPPKEVVAASMAYRDEQDVLESFISDRCTRISGLRSSASAIYQEYVRWSEEVGERPISAKAFGLAMTEKGFEKVKDSGNFYVGIGINSKPEMDRENGSYRNKF